MVGDRYADDFDRADREQEDSDLGDAESEGDIDAEEDDS